ETLHVLAADQRQVLAEFLPVEVVQHAAVLDLLLSHLVEHLRRARILRAQPVGESLIDAGILLLVGDREGEDFLFAQVGKALHRGIRMGSVPYIAVAAQKMRGMGRATVRDQASLWRRRCVTRAYTGQGRPRRTRGAG